MVNNSCYIDSLLLLFKMACIDFVNEILLISRYDHIQLARKIRSSLKTNDIPEFRKLMSQIDDGFDWMHDQNEPIDVLYKLNDVFQLPLTDVTEIIYKTNKQFEILNKSINNPVSHFASCIIHPSSKISLNQIDVIDTSDTEYIIKYEKIKCRKYILFHIVRNNHTFKNFTSLMIPTTLENGAKLIGCLIHTGDHKSGHYTASIHKNGKWIEYDGCSTNRIRSDVIYKNCTDILYQKSSSLSS